jgi:hypothetical protein
MIDRERLAVTVRNEFHRHAWETFIDEPPSVAHGGRGVVIPGCPRCRARLNTVSQFVDHLSEAVFKALSEYPQ